MRRFFTYALAGLILVSAPAAMAQGRDRGADRKQQEEAAKKKSRDREWNQPEAPLPALRNAGPCPYVKVLYDAGRYIEFEGGKEAAGNVVYSGEIQGLSSGCEYKDAEPIRVSLEALFALGKGPKATSDRKTYRYWVAVTTRNSTVITKEYFDLPVRFADDRTMVTEKLEGIVIPRASMETSGSNFEVLIGFDVTPQMAEFNRDGKRFRVSAGAPKAADSN
ncbi:MAG: Tat pathway signal sequence domain protein [Caulobacteraceae bacterium]|nr:Tat pathway signal sequence domain protein [Caulobacter sp.]RYF95421.1 MAG: Tat pathway signal sequence domain protein [Caulobacteraceae bacterium]